MSGQHARIEEARTGLFFMGKVLDNHSLHTACLSGAAAACQWAALVCR